MVMRCKSAMWENMWEKGTWIAGIAYAQFWENRSSRRSLGTECGQKLLTFIEWY